MGKIRDLLHSFKSLYFHCTLCQKYSKHSHQYLQRLAPPCLTAFRCACYCYSSSYLHPSAFVKLPCLATITTLSISWYEYPSPDPIVVSPGMSPNIKALEYGNVAFSNSIIRSRPISHLCRRITIKYRGHPPYLDAALRESPGQLTHLYYGDISSGLKYYLLPYPRPCRHLTAIGTLVFNSHKVSSSSIMHFKLIIFQYTEVLDDISALSVLERLESIEVNVGSLYPSLHHSLYDLQNGYYVCSRPQFRSSLADLNPNLRKIFLTDRSARNLVPQTDSTLWKKASPDWTCQMIPYYSYWEVLNRAYDDLCQSSLCYLC